MAPISVQGHVVTIVTEPLDITTRWCFWGALGFIAASMSGGRQTSPPMG